MNDLITISSNQVGLGQIQTVNARELHRFLEVGKDFSNWIKDRIRSYDFWDTIDYVTTLAKTGVRSNVTQIDYHLTLDMAKELSMVERNAKGKEARQYFIAVEKAYQKAPAQQTIEELLADPDLIIGLVMKTKQLTAERDEAVRTKAQIGSFREASAMGTASAAVRKVKVLEDRLGISEHYMTAKAIPWIS